MTTEMDRTEMDPTEMDPTEMDPTEMDHAYIERHQIVDGYLMGRLSEEEATHFEEHTLYCQECLEQVEFGEKLQRGLKRVVVEDATGATSTLAILAWLRRSGRFRQALPILAALVLLLPSALLYHQLGQARSELARAHEPQANLPLFSLNPLRGAPEGQEPVHQIRLSDAPEWFVFSLLLDRPQYDTYAVTLLDAEERVLWHGDGLEPSALDALVLSLHSGSLTAGDFMLRVEASPPGEEPLPVARFSFRVLPPS